MNKVHKITFDTTMPIEDTKKRVIDCVAKAYAEDQDQVDKANRFIKALFLIVWSTWDFDDEAGKALSAYEEMLKASSNERKISFATAYSIRLDDIVHDLVELAEEREKAHKGDKE